MARAILDGVAKFGIGKTGPLSNSKWWPAAPVMQASATGRMLFGENANRNNSLAKKTPAIGVPNMAAIPAVAPAANNTFRSFDVILNICPIVDPSAPPVAIIGPSAPKGPPVPIAMAEEIGFKKVIEGLIRLWF